MPAKPPIEHGRKVPMDIPPLDSGESDDPLDDLDIVEEGFKPPVPTPEQEGYEVERPKPMKKKPAEEPQVPDDKDQEIII